MANKFSLSRDERSSVMWGRLLRHMEELLQDCRTRNDGDLTDQQTFRLRGEIAMLKRIMRLGDEEKPQFDDISFG